VGLDAIPLKEGSEDGPTGSTSRPVPLLVWRETQSHTTSGVWGAVPYPLSHTRGDPVPNPTNVCGTAPVFPPWGAPSRHSGSSGWRSSTNLGEKRNTPQPHLRAPRWGLQTGRSTKVVLSRSGTNGKAYPLAHPRERLLSCSAPRGLQVDHLRLGPERSIPSAHQGRAEQSLANLGGQ